MSIRVMTSVWQYSKSKGSDLLLLLAIADRADDDGYAWPKVATLATKTRMSERATQYNLKRLVELGELEIQPNAGPFGTHLYRVVTKATGCKDCGVQDSTQSVQSLHLNGAKIAGSTVQPIAPNTSVDTSKILTSKHTKASKLAGVHVYDARFEEWYSHYPRKQDKRDAEAVWLRIDPSDEFMRQMIEAVDAACDSKQWQDKNHIPLPTTWLNGARWEDEVLPTSEASGTMPPDSTARNRAMFDELAEIRRRKAGGTTAENIIDTTGEVIEV